MSDAPESETPPPRAPTSVADAYRFFIPLMFMAELMMISHAIIAAFLARMSEPEPILAAYSVAFYLHATLGSPVWVIAIVSVSYIRDRASIHRLALFGLQTFASVVWIWLVIGATPVGDWFFQTLFGTGPEVSRAARWCTLIGILVPPLTIVRSIAYGLMMVNRRTLLVTYGTMIRLTGLAAILWALTAWREGAVIGMTALVGCIAVETAYSVVLARKLYAALPARSESPPGYRELWRFSWPIMMMQGAESGVAFAANLFLGRLARPELALAAFGIFDSLMRVLLSPLRNLVQTTQALVRTRADARSIILFAGHAMLVFGVMAALFNAEPVRRWVLMGLMGLPLEMADYVAPALQLSFLLALVMAAAGLTRGLLITSRRTGALAVSSGLRLVAVTLVGVAAVLLGAENGALIGLTALTAAFGAEAALLGGQLLRLDRRGSGLFTGR